MTDQDRLYYRSRISAEEMAAARATHPLAAECHRRLAAGYATLIAANDAETAPREASGGRR
jgi:hypothetical protein